MKCHLYFFLYTDADTAEYFASGVKQWVKEGVDADGIDAAEALNLNHETLDVWHNHPDVHEGNNGEVNAPEKGQRDAHEGRQQAVEPVFGHGEGGEAGLPDAIEAVDSLWFGDHVFKINLKGRKDRT